MEMTQKKNQKFHFTKEELISFHQKGYAGPFSLYEAQETKAIWRNLRLRLLERSNAVYQNEEEISGVTNISNYDRHLDVPFLAEHICRREIVDRVSSILGPNILCWRSEFFPKYPGDEGTDWHQADTFANASGSPQIIWPENKNFGGTITVWTAFTEATIDNGCLQFIPETHRTMYYDETKRMHYEPEKINKISKNNQKRGFFGYDYRQLQIEPNWMPDESKSVSIIMRPGEFILFWSTLMHASHPHQGKTNEMRMGYVARYVPTCVKIYPDTNVVEEYGGSINLDRYGAVLVAGKNEFIHNRIATQTTTGLPFSY